MSIPRLRSGRQKFSNERNQNLQPTYVSPEPIFQEIVQIKHQFETVYGRQPLLHSKPHITLAAFEMYSQDEEILFKVFDRLSEFKKFQIDIQGFEFFENNVNLLHLNVFNSGEIKEIHKLLKILWIRDLHRKLKSLKISNTPHVTISKTEGKKMGYESLDFLKRFGTQDNLKLTD